jgi:hypothetical protein
MSHYIVRRVIVFEPQTIILYHKTFSVLKIHIVYTSFRSTKPSELAQPVTRLEGAQFESRSLKI